MGIMHKYNDLAQTTRRLLAVALTVFIGGGVLASPVFADSPPNRLTDVDVSTMPGDRVQVRLRLSDAASEPESFTIDDPARIVLDLPNTSLDVRDRRTDIGVGAVRSVEVAEAQNRSRVVVNLSSSQAHDMRVDGNDIYLTIGDTDAREQIAAPDRPFEEPDVDPHEEEVVPDDAGIRSVDFRRGQEGEGRILVDLSDARTPIDVDEEAGKTVITFRGADISDELVRRMDVLDFATPVKYVDTRRVPEGVRMEIEPTGEFEKMAFQSENLFSLEYRPLTEREIEEREEREFTGERLTLNFQDIETRAVLQLIADFTDMNIVVADSVTGSVTLRLQNVPWDQALDIIMQTEGLDKRQTDNVILIAPAQEIAQREQQELERRQARQELVPLRSEFIQVNYARASDLASLIRHDDGRLMSDRGNVAVDDRTNTLLIQDTDEALEDIRELVNRLDIPVRQVLIESRIITATSDFSRELGSRFGVTHARERGDDGLLAVTGNAAGSDVMVGSAQQNLQDTGQALPVESPGLNDRLNVNLPVASPAGQLGVAILDSDYMVDLEISALQSEGRGEVVASPRVVTADQKEASIQQGVEIPYQTAQAGAGAGAITTQFEEAVLQLTVTPQITPDERVIMDLEVSSDTVGEEVPSGLGGFQPSIDTRSISTQAVVDNGETVVLGGIYETEQSEATTRVPILGDIPGLGVLFRSTTRSTSKAELLVFVTPKLLRDEAAVN